MHSHKQKCKSLSGSSDSIPSVFTLKGFGLLPLLQDKTFANDNNVFDFGLKINKIFFLKGKEMHRSPISVNTEQFPS